MTSRLPLALALLLSATATARAEEAVPAELQDIGIEERSGAVLPRDVQLQDQSGRSVRLGEYLDDGRPVVLALAYYSCPMLCTLVLNGMTEGLKGVAWNAGERYRVLVVSIDPRETPKLAHDKRENYLRDYGRLVPEKGFEFLVGSEAEVRRLADAVGFKFRWDEASKQYAHAAGLFVITPDGRLSRTLYGISFPSRDLRLALVEASEGKLGSAWDRVVLFCFHYDPSARSYVLAATRAMQAAGAVTVLLLGILLFALWRRDARRSQPEEGMEGRVA